MSLFRSHMAGKCVVSAFLLMALVSNAVAARFNIPRGLSYGVLVCLLVPDFWFPCSHLNGGSAGMKIILGRGWVALPVFSSGAIPVASKELATRLKCSESIYLAQWWAEFWKSP